jgi:hypothetical protein
MGNQPPQKGVGQRREAQLARGVMEQIAACIGVARRPPE